MWVDFPLLFNGYMDSEEGGENYYGEEGNEISRVGLRGEIA